MGAPRWTSLALAAVAATTLATPAPAQLPTDTFDLPEIVVTANRVPRHRDLVPAPVTVITRETIQRRGIRTVAEALTLVPGVSVSRAGSDGAQTSTFLRGGESNYVQVLIDGVKANDPGGSFDFADLSTDNIERIEVVRGPTSVLYGSDAVTGVIQIFTRRGEGSPRVTASLRGGVGAETVDEGSYGTLDVEAAIAGGGDVVDYSAALSRYDTDGLLPFNNDYTSSVLSGRLAVTPDGRTDLSGTVRYTDARYHFPTDGAGNVVDRNAFSERDALTVALDAGRFLTDRVEARVLAGHRVHQRRVQDDFDDADDTSAFRSTTEMSRTSLGARANAYLDATILTLGAEVEREAVEGESLSRSAFGDFPGATDEDRSNRAIYGQLVTTIAGRLAITAGARLEDNERFGTFDTYRGGVSYRLGTGTRIRAAAGTAFKAPGFDENFGSGFGDRGNPDLEPEQSTSWELGLEQRLLDDRVRVGITYFDQSFEELIQFTFAPPEPDDPNYFNVGGAAAEGVELAGEAKVGRLGVEVHASRIETEVTDAGLATDFAFVEGMPLLRRPEWSAGGSAHYDLERATFGFALEHVGGRDDLDFSTGDFPAPRTRLPGYRKLDLFGEYQLTTGAGRLTATARLDNVLDERYAHISGFPAPGRSLTLGLRLGLGGGS